jgi:curli production assembly/transport component CsgG
LDGVVQGKRDDQYFNFSFGLNWYFGNPAKVNRKSRLQRQEKTVELRELRKRNRKIRKEDIIREDKNK